jgi:hypothetical protein
MSTFDPNAVRKAVEEFTPRRPEKFQDLMPAKAVIAELRQKRASYRAVAELLTQHCLPTSKTAIAMFCHQVLGETVHPRRRPGRKRPIAPIELNGHNAAALPTELLAPVETTNTPEGNGIPATPVRGPRIAQIRKLNPSPHEKTDSHP